MLHVMESSPASSSSSCMSTFWAIGASTVISEQFCKIQTIVNKTNYFKFHFLPSALRFLEEDSTTST